MLRILLPGFLFLSSIAYAANVELSGVGSWYGEGQPDDKDQVWLSRHEGNGKFSIVSRKCNNGVAADNAEEGTWSYKSGLLEIVTTLVDGKPAH
jgi:hypothetical protein